MNDRNAHFERARLLVGQHRYDMAEKELRLVLGQSPENAQAHSLLALCLLERKAYQDATDAAQQAVHLAPENPDSYYYLAWVLTKRNDVKKAEEVISQALTLGIHDSYFALLASLRLQRKDWRGGLEAAGEGLALNPENIECLNLQATAQRKLGLKADASETLRGALAKDPDDSDTHATLGWTLLEQGDQKQALHHFREALRLDPESDFARSGMVETLKARNIIYRVMLSYILWMAKLKNGAQWAVIIGAYVAFRILRSVGENNPEMRIWVQPLVWLYIAFAIMTWLADPLFNLMLRLSRDGRLALTRDNIVASNWVGMFLLLAIVFFVAALCLPQYSFLIIWALMCALMILPLSAIFKCDEGWPRNWMIVYTITMGLCATAFVALDVFVRTIDDSQVSLIESLLGFALLVFYAFLAGAVLTGFVANWLIMQRPRL